MTYEELWAEFEGDRDDGYSRSFTDWMVARLETWEEAALARIRTLEHRVSRLQNAPTIPQERYRALERELAAAQQQLVFERSQHAAAPNLGYARGTTQGDTIPPTGVNNDTLRRLDEVRQQRGNLQPGQAAQDELDRFVRGVFTDLNDPREP